jgi:hypothetical protein
LKWIARAVGIAGRLYFSLSILTVYLGSKIKLLSPLLDSKRNDTLELVGAPGVIVIVLPSGYFFMSRPR